MTARQLGTVFVALFVLGLVPGSISAQLISPGKLSESHSSLEGISMCTSCHVLGERGVARQLCLDCHTPLADRISSRKGYHASVASRDCAECHKEHFGVDFEVVHFDRAAFNHDDTGFPLVASHQRVDCRGCHQPEYVVQSDVRVAKGREGVLEKTYLGLSDRCATCHLSDTPHRNQFVSRDCASCHQESRWPQTDAFDHDTARFRLEGRHRQVACEGCHPVQTNGESAFTVYRELEFSGCASCHADPHGGRMGGATCTTCHSVSGWANLSARALESGFDHARTGFALRGSHREVDCSGCHGKPASSSESISIEFVPGTERHSFPRPEATSCASCHNDFHGADFVASENIRAACESCHSERSWLPSSYDMGRHNRDSRFELTGAHLSVPCIACHRSDGGSRPTFARTDRSCISCHAGDDIHRGQFSTDAGPAGCEQCHRSDSWSVSDGFDHNTTRFPLSGRHREIQCASCHAESESAAGTRVFRGTSVACSTCHAGADPHQSQFVGKECSSCHDDVSFRIVSFNHDDTRFPLGAAHGSVACASCHRGERTEGGTEFTRFTPLGTECIDCHANG